MFRPFVKGVGIALSPQGRKAIRSAVALARSNEARKVVAQARKVASSPEGRKLVNEAVRAASHASHAVRGPEGMERLKAAARHLAERRR